MCMPGNNWDEVGTAKHLSIGRGVRSKNSFVQAMKARLDVIVIASSHGVDTEDRFWKTPI
jgi:hypothetical protein